MDPPLVVSGRRIAKGPLDYVAFPSGRCVGIEAKNYRTWLYPRSNEVRELLWKCADIDAIPVLVARRLPFITIRLLQLGGCLVHENYNQLYPSSDAALATQVRDKNLLGYHDVRAGSTPDLRMQRFFTELLPSLAPAAYPRFALLRDAHHAYGSGVISYSQWVKRIREVTGPWRRAVRDEARSGD